MDPKRILCLTAPGVNWEGLAVYLAEQHLLVRQAGQDLTGGAAPDWPPHLILLSVHPDEARSFELCRNVKTSLGTSRIPLVALAADALDTTRIRALEAGADDCLSTPFSPRELHVRIKNILRRVDAVREGEIHILRLRDLSIDLEAHRVECRGAEVALPSQEMVVLMELARREGRTVAQHHLPPVLERSGSNVGPVSLDVVVRRLRQKLGVCGRFLRKVRGGGYRLE